MTEATAQAGAVEAEALPDPSRPLANVPWVRVVDRLGIPSFAFGVCLMLACLPFYDYNALTPQLPLSGAAFPPEFVLALSFLLFLTRGATSDFRTLVGFGRVELGHIAGLVASRRSAFIELAVGVVIGMDRVARQIRFDGDANADWFDPARLLVCFTIVGYTVLQVHLLTFCVRQALVHRRVAQSFKLDLLAPELNSLVSNPLIRFLIIGLVSVSFGMLLFELAPYASLQRRVVGAGALGVAIWVMLLRVSFIPLFVSRRRIGAAKTVEINLVRRALRGDRDGLAASAFGPRLEEFSAADLMYYEDRVRAVWEWPFESHIRRVVIFGLLPPLTWVLAAGVEIIFESALAG